MNKAAIFAALACSIIFAREAKALGPWLVFYDSGSIKLDAQAAGIADNFAQAWHSNGTYRIEIWGHADQKRSAASNRRLSCARAAEVPDFLAAREVPRSRMAIAGYGSTRPLIDDPREEMDYRQNRRTDMVFVPDGQSAFAGGEIPPRCPSAKGSRR